MMKTRDIALCDLFSQLQLEYIDYKVKSLIYKAPYNEKYVKICKVKKDKIDKISIKNRLTSIFDSPKKYEDVKSRFFNEWGLPNFQYREPKIREQMSLFDNLYYFAQKSSVCIKIEGEEVLGEVLFNNVKEEILTVRIPGQKSSVLVDYSRSRRIFSRSFEEAFNLF